MSDSQENINKDDDVDNLKLAGTGRRFWTWLVPGYLLFGVVAIGFSNWSLSVFSPRADPALRFLAGYFPLILLALYLLILIFLYRRYMGQSFEFTPTGLDFRQRGIRHEFLWDEVLIKKRRYDASIRDSKREAFLHSFFFPELQRLCSLVKEAHRHKREERTVRA